MTNGRGAGMASFMTKKKKYKFQVEICLEELLEVPFVSAVLFAKLRLLDGGSFQDHSSRQEVQDHKVQWGANFTFPCKMMANASTGVMERCILRISIRKECKGGRSFTKLGFVDLNLAEYAGAGQTHKRALLEGYDARHRQDNSMLKFKIALNMISGDILFKAPSPSLKHKPVNVEEPGTEQRSDDFSNGSLAGSIASGSSGFGSLPKKRPALLSSELVIGQTLSENNIPVTTASDCSNDLHPVVPVVASIPHLEHDSQDVALCEQGHSRNSSNTSQLSKASGYSSIHSHSHSRQSSSGDSGHIRDLHSRSVRAHQKHSQPLRPNTYPRKINIPNTILSSPSTPFTSASQNIVTSTPVGKNSEGDQTSIYGTPRCYHSQFSHLSNSSGTEEYRTPEVSFNNRTTDVFSQNFNELQKSSSTSIVERIKSYKNIFTVDEVDHRKSDTTHNRDNPVDDNRHSLKELKMNRKNNPVPRCKSEFEIPRLPTLPPKESLSSKLFNSDSLFSFLTPRPKRKSVSEQNSPKQRDSPPNMFKIPQSHPFMKSLPETRTTSLNSLRSGSSANEGLTVQPVQRGMSHRKLLEGVSAGKLAPLAISPDDQNDTNIIVTDVSSDVQNPPSGRRPSVTTNPSASSLVLSETGSLDRAKAAYERRKKNQNQDTDVHSVPDRVEMTRVNPDDLIEELLKNTNLEQPDDSAENSGLQLFIAKDGTAALGNHEVKSQMSTGVQVFKQVVMNNR